MPQIAVQPYSVTVPQLAAEARESTNKASKGGVKMMCSSRRNEAVAWAALRHKCWDYGTAGAPRSVGHTRLVHSWGRSSVVTWAAKAGTSL